MNGVAVKLMFFAVNAEAAAILHCLHKMTLALNSQSDFYFRFFFVTDYSRQ